MTEALRWAFRALVVGGILGGLFWARSFLDRQEALWEARAERVEAEADSLLRENAGLREEADSAAARAERAESAAARVDTQIVVLRERVEADTVPPGCELVVARRDTLIWKLVIRADSLDLALQERKEEVRTLRLAEVNARKAADSLRNVLKDRPTGKWWLFFDKPKPSAFGGVCSDGETCVGVGIAIGVG